jgi:UPF0716 family protein affecting phage T7 exclusion
MLFIFVSVFVVIIFLFIFVKLSLYINIGDQIGNKLYVYHVVITFIVSRTAVMITSCRYFMQIRRRRLAIA